MIYTIIYNNLYKHSQKESLYTKQYRDFPQAKEALIASLSIQMQDLQRKLDNVRAMTEDEVIDLDERFYKEKVE